MRELAADDVPWQRWRYRMPSIVDAQPPAGAPLLLR
jgi:hypothetical protein